MGVSGGMGVSSEALTCGPCSAANLYSETRAEARTAARVWAEGTSGEATEAEAFTAWVSVRGSLPSLCGRS